MPAPNRCQLSAVPKQEQILLDRGQRAVTPRSTKVNGPSEAGPVTVNRTPPRPGRSGDEAWISLCVQVKSLFIFVFGDLKSNAENSFFFLSGHCHPTVIVRTNLLHHENLLCPPHASNATLGPRFYSRRLDHGLLNAVSEGTQFSEAACHRKLWWTTCKLTLSQSTCGKIQAALQYELVF